MKKTVSQNHKNRFLRSFFSLFRIRSYSRKRNNNKKIYRTKSSFIFNLNWPIYAQHNNDINNKKATHRNEISQIKHNFCLRKNTPHRYQFFVFRISSRQLNSNNYYNNTRKQASVLVFKANSMHFVHKSDYFMCTFC